MSKPTVSSYKGNDILVLNPDQKFPFSFGKGKALLILQHLDAIREFAGVQDPSQDLADAADDYLDRQ